MKNKAEQVIGYTTIKALAAMVLVMVAVDAATFASDEFDWKAAAARYVGAVALGLARALKGEPVDPAP